MISIAAVARQSVVFHRSGIKSIQHLSSHLSNSEHYRQFSTVSRNLVELRATPTTYRAITTKMASEKPQVIFVLGGPGAGKGTQCQRIMETYNFGHLSAGDLLREERAREGSEVGALIENYIRNGQIVPVEITCSLLEKAMKSSGKNKFLIDGFPRNQDNVDGWNRKMGDKVDFKFVIFFKCQDEVCVERCLKRGQSSGRTDDNLESLKKRIATYHNDSLPIIKYYENLGKVVTIDANNDADTVFKEVQKVVSQL